MWKRKKKKNLNIGGEKEKKRERESECSKIAHGKTRMMSRLKAQGKTVN